jgi:hypothetical protein
MISAKFGKAIDTAELKQLLSTEFEDNSVLQLTLLVAHCHQVIIFIHIFLPFVKIVNFDYIYCYKKNQSKLHYSQYYLRSLPKSFTTPLYWDVEDFQNIVNPITLERAITSVV